MPELPNPFDTGERFEPTAFDLAESEPREFVLNEPSFMAVLRAAAVEINESTNPARRYR